MAASTNTINITAVDNQLLIYAFQWGASFLICQILSGNSNSVNVTIPISNAAYQQGVYLNGVNNPLSGTYPVSLSSGAYSLVAIGIDWGGPVNFAFSLNGQSYSLPLNNNPNPDKGVLWHPDPISLTI